MTRSLTVYFLFSWNLHTEFSSCRKRAASFVASNYTYETGGMTGILHKRAMMALDRSRELRLGMKVMASVE